MFSGLAVGDVVDIADYRIAVLVRRRQKRRARSSPRAARRIAVSSKRETRTRARPSGSNSVPWISKKPRESSCSRRRGPFPLHVADTRRPEPAPSVGGSDAGSDFTISYEDLDRRPDGWIITIQLSKTDPYGRGQYVPPPALRAPICPTAAVAEWLTMAAITEGPVFRTAGPDQNVASALRASQVGVILRAMHGLGLSRRWQAAGTAIDAATEGGHQRGRQA